VSDAVEPLWTIHEVADHLGVQVITARSMLSRWGIKAVCYRSHPDSKRRQARYAVGEIRGATAGRPGRGSRVDLYPAGWPRPVEVLERLYVLELAEVAPLPARLWQVLAQILFGTPIDISWIEEPGVLIAGEIDNANDDGSGGLAEGDAALLSAAARTWSRIQALAILHSLARKNLDSLPTAADPASVRLRNP
jgi:hypothetical protein